MATSTVPAMEDCDDGGESMTCDGDCTVAICGDGTLNMTAGESCDDGGDSATCDSDCTDALCGDGHANTSASEQCDDGGDSATCDSDCTAAECGDGHVNAAASEDCDDMGESATCDIDCTTPVCGDGVFNASAGEICDDGGNSATCDNDCTLPMCGDGVYNPAAGEECDDGNMVPGDGCAMGCIAEFDTATFTPCGQVGRLGPDQAACDLAYLGTDIEGQVTVTAGIQYWTVPVTGNWQITVAGARGGHPHDGDDKFGYGAVIVSTISLAKDEVLGIIVGQHGSYRPLGETDWWNSSGGGGTFVFRDVNDPFPIMAAGGGAGGSYSEPKVPRMDASLTTSGNPGTDDGGSMGGAGGINGTGGATENYVYSAGAGAGWLTNGTGSTNVSCTYTVENGFAPRNGGAGGQGGNVQNGGAQLSRRIRRRWWWLRRVRFIGLRGWRWLLGRRRWRRLLLGARRRWR